MELDTTTLVLGILAFLVVCVLIYFFGKRSKSQSSSASFNAEPNLKCSGNVCHV